MTIIKSLRILDKLYHPIYGPGHVIKIEQHKFTVQFTVRDKQILEGFNAHGCQQVTGVKDLFTEDAAVFLAPVAVTEASGKS